MVQNASEKKQLYRNQPDSTMNEVFHENMVIWKQSLAWDAFGFFGGGLSGKSTVSFDFALRLLRDGILDIKVFDDRFFLDGNTVERDPKYPPYGEDRTGKRTEFEQEAKSRNMQLEDFLPAIGEKYELGNVTIWFLSPSDDLEYRRNALGFDDFLEFLAPKDPFHFLKSPTVDDLIPHFKMGWKYELFELRKPISVHVLEKLAELARYQTNNSTCQTGW